ncbi:hypothetical protein QP519_03060 [Weeksella virosa]|uniref:hypothetical protein n=1 Tax=Weeksella virosa TaxID=1014 RepID=UPI0025571096|nr:hypothetical protein [Weeksella virosa]MDK7374516.1 hypothetical protein [Weeksella virosa]
MVTNLEFTIPTDWNKLNLYQASEILHLLYNAEKITPELREKMLSILFIDENPLNEDYSSNYKCIKYAELLKETTPAIIEEEINPLGFIFHSMTLTKFPSTLEISHNGTTHIFYGPANRLANVTIEEFSFCDHIFYDWKTKKKPQYLDILITALYRPKATENNQDDIRERFSRHNLSSRSSILPKIDEKIKLVIGHAFQGSRESIINRFPVIFPKKKFKTAKPKSIKYKTFNTLINAMVLGENQPLGNLHQVEQTNVIKFFDIVQESIIRNRKKIEEQKKRK